MLSGWGGPLLASVVLWGLVGVACLPVLVSARIRKPLGGWPTRWLAVNYAMAVGAVVFGHAGVFLAGVIGFEFFAAFLLIALGLGSLLTVFAVFGEVVTYRRYERPREILILLCYAIVENVTYRPWRTFVRCWATAEYIAGDRSWGTMTRTGAATGEQSDERK